MWAGPAAVGLSWGAYQLKPALCTGAERFAAKPDATRLKQLEQLRDDITKV